MRWLKKQYHRYMIRPIVTKTITRTLIGLVIVLLWDKYVNVERIGVSRLGFGLGAVGIILMAGAWFSYLHLDGLTPIDTAKKKFGVKNKKKKTKQSMGGDIADTSMRKLCRMRSWMNLKRSMSDGSLFDFWNDPCDRWDCDPTLLRSHKKQAHALLFS